MKEMWKPIDGYDGVYCVSNLGRIKSVQRNIKYSSANQFGDGFDATRDFPEKILKTFITRGYEHVSLKKKANSKTFQVHRLVATYFVPNPNNYPIINHKDENKLNNRADNLEWCTHKYNANYGTRNKRIADKLKDNPYFYIPVLCYTLDNKFVRKFESAVEAGKKVGISPSGITTCCRLGYGRTSAGGFKWKYEKSNIDIESIDYKPQTKEVLQFDLDGNYIFSFKSKSEAAKAHKKNVRNFSKAVEKGYAYDSLWIIANNFESVSELLTAINKRRYHIYQIDLKGNVVGKFKSALDVASKLGFNPSNISNAISSKTKEGKTFRTYRGFYWVDIITDYNYEIDFLFKRGHGEKRVAQYDLSGNKLMEFNSIRDAQEYIGIDRNKSSSIYDCFKPNTKKKTAYGYIWKRI